MACGAANEMKPSETKEAILEKTIVKDPVRARQGDRKLLNYRVLTMSLLIAVAVAALLYGGYYAVNTADNAPPPAGQQKAL